MSDRQALSKDDRCVSYALDDQLFLAQSMETFGKLAVGLTHDVGNMLTPIMTYSQLIANALPAGSHLHSYLQEIQAAAETLADLTTQIASLSPTTLIGPNLIDLNDVILAMDKLLRRIVGKEIRLVTCLDPELETMRADRTQIQQVLINLVFNAQDAMPRGGTLTIQTANITPDDEDVRRRPESPGGQIVMVVGDTGIGMTNEVRERIFEPFFTTKESGRGTGLGLAMCSNIVAEAGGHIAVDSEPGRGSRFRVFLPKAKDIPVL